MKSMRFLPLCALAATAIIISAGAANHHVKPKAKGNAQPADTANAIYETGAKAQLVSKQFLFTEGPATDKKGNVFFTDQPNNKIWEYSTDGKLSIFLDSAGRSNGMFFDKKGNLISCADEHDQLWSIAPDKKITVLISNFGGKLLNGPNDVWVERSSGNMYFTDPYFQRDYWTRKQPDIKAQNVYFLPKGAKEAVIANDKLRKPNGIVGTPDGKYLYVADGGAGKTYKFTIAPDGSLTDQQLFCNLGSDGMTLDNQGNVYLTGKGVTVFSPAGIKLAHIDIDEPWTANICFAGKNKDILFITASKAVYILKTKVKGVE